MGVGILYWLPLGLFLAATAAAIIALHADQDDGYPILAWLCALIGVAELILGSVIFGIILFIMAGMFVRWNRINLED